MKISDESLDLADNTILAIITGLLCVVFTIMLCVTSGDAACIFIAILVSNILAKKVDSINHIISAIILILLLVVLGVPHFSWICLIGCIIASYIDEWGNDKSDKKEEKIKVSQNNENMGVLDNFFKYRWMLKLMVLVFSILGLINYYTSWFIGWYFFEPVTFIYFYLFDFAYEFAGYVFDRFYGESVN